MFLYIDPLKQGLKPRFIRMNSSSYKMFLYIDPLKQGLKPRYNVSLSCFSPVFIHRSIKTRIETKPTVEFLPPPVRFLYIDPLKQGLKQKQLSLWNNPTVEVFIHRSIKTRIETWDDCFNQANKRVFIHRSIKTRIETILIKPILIDELSFYT